MSAAERADGERWNRVPQLMTRNLSPHARRSLLAQRPSSSATAAERALLAIAHLRRFVAGSVYLAHPARAKLADDPVVREAGSAGQPERRRGHRGRLVRRGEQRVDLPAERGVAFTAGIEVGMALARFERQRRADDAGDLLPAVHGRRRGNSTARVTDVVRSFARLWPFSL